MSPRVQAELERFEQWQKMHVANPETVETQGVQEPPVNWLDAYSTFADLPHPNSMPDMLPGSINWLYQDYGGEG